MQMQIWASHPKIRSKLPSKANFGYVSECLEHASAAIINQPNGVMIVSVPKREMPDNLESLRRWIADGNKIILEESDDVNNLTKFLITFKNGNEKQAALFRGYPFELNYNTDEILITCSGKISTGEPFLKAAEESDKDNSVQWYDPSYFENIFNNKEGDG